MRKLIVGLIALALLLVPTTADAHWLSAYRAKKVAKRVAYKVADYGDYYGARGCYRLSRHAVVCTIVVEPADTDLICEAEILIRFVSSYSYRTRWRSYTRFDCY